MENAENGTDIPVEIVKLCLDFYPMIEIASTICTENERKVLLDMLEDHIETDIADISLLYDMKRDGKETFHTLCDGKGPTLTVMHTKDNQVVGGYISKSWRKGALSEHTDKTAFIYLLRSNNGLQPTKYPVKDASAAYYNGYEGPAFGYGCCLAVRGERNSPSDAFACDQTHYDFKPRMLRPDHRSRVLTFNLINYEVFQVQLEGKTTPDN